MITKIPKYCNPTNDKASRWKEVLHSFPVKNYGLRLADIGRLYFTQVKNTYLMVSEKLTDKNENIILLKGEAGF